MTINLAMGLRADEAREILKRNGYTREEYLLNDSLSDGLGYLCGITACFGGFSGGALAKSKLKMALMNGNKEEMGKAYAACKDEFGEKITNVFVKKYISHGNVKSVYGLSIPLDKTCQDYYSKNKRELDEKNYFNQFQQ